MLPILFTIGPIKIYTFGVFLMLAFFWGSFFIWKLIRLTSFKEDEIFDGLFWMLGGGLFLARLIYVLLNFKDFGFDFFKFILINGYPGLSLFGGFIGGIMFFYLYCLSKKIKFREIIDYLTPGFLIALSFEKLGGFFSGSEIGIKANFFTTLTPLYESFIFIFGTYISYKIIFEIRKNKLSRGFNLYFFIWSISFTYFIFDKIKANNLYFAGQSFNKIVSGSLLLTISFYFVYYFRSLLFKKGEQIKNFLFYYGKDISKKIRTKSKAEVGRRQEENIPTDR